MALLNIKTGENYYLYDNIGRQILYSNQLTYDIAQSLESKGYLLNNYPDSALSQIAISVGAAEEAVSSIMKRISYLSNALCTNSSLSCDNEISPPYIDDAMVRESLSGVKQIVIEITQKCNFQCYYCCYGDFYEEASRRDKDVDIDNCIGFLKEIMSLHSVYLKSPQHILISFYGGEPLLNIEGIKRVVDFIQLNKTENLGVSYSLTTNGYNLDRHISFLKEYDFNVTISLDGNETQNGYRKLKNGRATFRRVWNNVLKIRFY